MMDLLAWFGFALLMWWLSTGFILFLNHRHPGTYPWTLAVASLLVIGALLGIAAGSDDTSKVAALLAFAQALVVWAWLEMSYFMGIVTGPRKTRCPTGARGWSRFVMGIQTSLYHELGVIVLGLVIVFLTWDAPNQVAAGTYLTLWAMRWSAKLNLFFGVPNVNTEWFPQPLRFLGSYMRNRPMNLFFPFAITLATGVFVWIIGNAIVTTDVFQRTSYALIGSLLGLAILEHWFLVLPLRDSALWDWALRLAGQPDAKVSGPDADCKNAASASWRCHSTETSNPDVPVTPIADATADDPSNPRNAPTKRIFRDRIAASC